MEWKVESEIETARGNDCLVIRSEQGRYKYSRIRELSSGETRYRCTNRRCNVNVFIGRDNRVVRASSLSHNHPGLRATQYTLVRLRTACKQYARENLGTKPLDELIKDAYDIGAYSMPASKKRLLRKAISTAKRHVMAQVMKQQTKFGQEASPLAVDEDGIRAPLKEETGGPAGDDRGMSEPAEWPAAQPIRVKAEFRLTAEEEAICQSDQLVVKEELLEDVPVPRAPDLEELSDDKTTQTDRDDDQEFLDRLYPMMKLLSAPDKSMMKAQIQQLFMWKLNKSVT